MFQIRTATFAAGAFLALPGLSHAQSLPPIAELVTPSDTALIAEAPSVAALMEAIEGSAFAGILGDGEVAPTIVRLLGVEDVTADDLADRLRIDADALAWPEGSLGVVVPPTWQDDFSQRMLDAMDAQDGVPAQRLRGEPLLVVEFGEAGPAWRETIDAAMDYAEDQGWIEFNEGDEVGGVEVFEVSSLIHTEWNEAREEIFGQVLEEERESGEFRSWEETERVTEERLLERVSAGDAVDDTLAGLFAQVESIAWAWSGDTLVLAGQAGVVAEILLGGEEGLDAPLAESAFYRSSIDAVDAAQLRVVVNADTLLESTLQATGQVATDQIFDSLGINNVESLAFGIDLRSPEGLAEMPMLVLVPDKAGLFRLFDRELGSFDMPAVVPANVEGAYRLSVRFDQILPLARDVIESLPPEEQQQAQFGFEQAAFIAGPILEQMEPEVTVVMFDSAPPEQDPFQLLAMPDFMVLCALRDEAPLLNALSGFGAAAGLAGREFGGGTIFEAEGAGVDLGIGVGHGYAIVGTPVRIEDALRRASGADVDGLNDDPEFIDAVGRTAGRGLAVSYTSGAATLEAWQGVIEALEVDGLGDRLSQRLLEDLEGVLGATIAELRITDDGYAGRLLILERD